MKDERPLQDEIMDCLSRHRGSCLSDDGEYYRLGDDLVRSLATWAMRWGLREHEEAKSLREQLRVAEAALRDCIDEGKGGE